MSVRKLSFPEAVSEKWPGSTITWIPPRNTDEAVVIMVTIPYAFTTEYEEVTSLPLTYAAVLYLEEEENQGIVRHDFHRMDEADEMVLETVDHDPLPSEIDAVIRAIGECRRLMFRLQQAEFDGVKNIMPPETISVTAVLAREGYPT